MFWWLWVTDNALFAMLLSDGADDDDGDDDSNIDSNDDDDNLSIDLADQSDSGSILFELSADQVSATNLTIFFTFS